eukprot:TRINITY_DN1521_c0_g1_i1.p1 TRINITY_DN1521_c0_g1~~TRINITY_DN1521_c0_g1_i1.p1  ORF type:complete len:755 (-),score=178.26 TRINITY_DN1521_c0_g1_i1:8-2272(-)
MSSSSDLFYHSMYPSLDPGVVVSDVQAHQSFFYNPPSSEEERASRVKQLGITPPKRWGFWTRASLLVLYYIVVVILVYLVKDHDGFLWLISVLGFIYVIGLVLSFILQVFVGLKFTPERSVEQRDMSHRSWQVVIPTHIPQQWRETEENDAQRNEFEDEEGMAYGEGSTLIRGKIENLERMIDSLLNEPVGFSPENVILVENGRNMTPSKEIIKLCNDKKVKYAYLPIPSKSIAAYFGVHHFTSDAIEVVDGEASSSSSSSSSSSRRRRILIMDDDVVLTSSFQSETRHQKEWVGQTFQLTADYSFPMNDDGEREGVPSFIQAAQDAEFFLAIRFKLVQELLGSLFRTGVVAPHGAISAWDRNVFLDVMRDHDTVFHGEDLQMGLVFHSMAKRGTDEKIIANVRTAVITEVMDSFSNACRGGTTRSGDAISAKKSLFDQRVKSWDATQFRFKFIRMYLLNAFFCNNGCCQNWGIMLWCMFELMLIFRDVFLRFALLVLIILRSDALYPLFIMFLVIFIVDVISMSLILGKKYFIGLRAKCDDSPHGASIPFTWGWVFRFACFMFFYKFILSVFRQVSFWYAVTHPMADADPIRDRKLREIPVGSVHYHLLNNEDCKKTLYATRSAEELAEKWKEVWTLWENRNVIEDVDSDGMPQPPCCVISQKCVEHCATGLASDMDVLHGIEAFSSSPHDQTFIRKIQKIQITSDSTDRKYVKDLMDNLLHQLDKNRDPDALYSYVAFDRDAKPITSGLVKK